MNKGRDIAGRSRKIEKKIEKIEEDERRREER